MRDQHSSNDGRHEPRQAFVEQLEHRIVAQARRQEGVRRGSITLTRGALALAASLVAVVSAAVGGGAVVVAQQAQRAELRDRLVSTYEQRLALERQRLGLVRESLADAERRSAIGVDTLVALMDARARVAEAEAAVRLVELQLAEVRASGQEPVTSASAPLVSGRDFVSERWQVELSVPQAALELARKRLQAEQVRFNVGLARSEDVEAAGLRAIEIEAALHALQQKLRIRQLFVKGLATAAITDLRVLEAEAEQRRLTLERRIDLAARQLKDMEVRVQIGTLAPLDLAGARLRLQELQLGLTKAVYDLDLIRAQIKRQRE